MAFKIPSRTIAAKTPENYYSYADDYNNNHWSLLSLTNQLQISQLGVWMPYQHLLGYILPNTADAFQYYTVKRYIFTIIQKHKVIIISNISDLQNDETLTFRSEWTWQ